MKSVEQSFEEAKSIAVQENKDRSFVSSRKLARELRIERKRLEEEEAAAKATPEAFADVFSSFAPGLKKRYAREFQQHTAAVAHAVPFVDPIFDSYFKLTPGQLVAVAAYTGEGKSTNAANIAAAAVEAGKRAVILSNEEKSSDFMDMVACLNEGLYHREFVDRTMHADDQKRMMKRVATLLKEKQFIALDTEDTGGGTTKDDYVLNALKAMAAADVRPDVVVIDYLTNIYAVGSTTADNHYYQLERFLGELKNLINHLPFPVVVCAQMHSQDKKKGQKGKPAALDTRLVMGGAIQRYATLVLEVQADFEAKVSTVTIHKNRTYKEKGVVALVFDRGRLVFVPADELLARGQPKDDGTESVKEP